MKKYRFKLETVLRVASIKEREAEGRFYSTNGKMREAIELKKCLEQEIKATQTLIADGENLEATLPYLEALTIELNKAQCLILSRKEECKQKKEELFEKRVKRKMIEKIKEKDYTHHLKTQQSEYV